MDRVYFLTSMGLLAAICISAVGGTTCSVCTQTSVTSDNTLINSIMQGMNGQEEESCQDGPRSEDCDGSCQLVLTSFDLNMDALPAPVTAYSQARTCFGFDQVTQCTDTTELVSNMMTSLFSNTEISLTNLKSATCFCSSDNCNTDVANINSNFSSYASPAAGLDPEDVPSKCYECDYLVASSNDTTQINPLIDSIESNQDCINPPSAYYITCAAGEKCIFVNASLVLNSDLGNGMHGVANVSWVSRHCIKPEKHTANTCYVNIDKDAQIFDAMMGHFDSNDLVTVEDFDATACLCEGEDYCNGDSTEKMKDELGVSSKGVVVRAGPWIMMGFALKLLMWC